MKAEISLRRTRFLGVLRAAAAAAALSAAVGSPATSAAPVLYVFTGQASGTWNGAPFSSENFSIAVSGDTDGVTQDMEAAMHGLIVFHTPYLPGSIAVAGIGIGLFSESVQVFVNQTYAAVGVSRAWPGDLFDATGAPFATVDLVSSFGPQLAPTAFPVYFEAVPTSLGSITFGSVSDVVFEVVPEPGAMGCAGAALLCVACLARRRRSRRAALFAAAAFAAALAPSEARAALILIHNGLAPPEPLNVIDASDAWAGDEILVRNAGCGTELDPDATCVELGVATRVDLVSGGAIAAARVRETSNLIVDGGTIAGTLRLVESAASTLIAGSVGDVVAEAFTNFVLVDGTASTVFAYDSAHVGVNGGSVGSFAAYDAATLRVFAGAAGSELFATGGATVEISGGAFEATLTMGGSASAMIFGRDFRVDGLRVPPGEIAATLGVLTGELDSSEPLQLDFVREETARIELVPEPAAGGALAASAVLALRRAAGQRPRRGTKRAAKSSANTVA